MERLKLKASRREVGKKGANRRLRKSGFVPTVLYGRGMEPEGLAVPAKEFKTLLKGHAGMNVLIDLEVESAKPLVVMIKDNQIDFVTREITHLDFLKIDLTEKVTVNIPIQLTGKSIGVTQGGGLVEQPKRELEVRCLPGNIPEAIEVDITNLNVGDSLHVKDMTLPEGVEVVGEVDYAIVSIVAPREEVVEVAPVAAVEGAAATTGETAPAAAGGEAKGEVKAEGKAEAKKEVKKEGRKEGDKK